MGVNRIGKRDNGNWEDWILFFLRGVNATSRSALSLAQEIIHLRETVLKITHENLKSAKAPLLAEKLFQNPYITVKKAAQILSVTYPTANTVIGGFVEHSILEIVPTRGRERIFAFREYLDLLHTSTDDLSPAIDGDDHLSTEGDDPQEGAATIV